MKPLSAHIGLFCVITIGSLSAGPTNAVTLNLQNALHIAERHSPSLRASVARQIAAEQRARAAGLPANPRLVLGSEAIRGSRSGETLFGVSQSVPLGKERKLDRAAAEADRDRAALQVDAERLRLGQRVRGAFATALFAQHSERLFSERIAILKTRLRLATARADAGDAISELSELAHAALDHEQLEREQAATMRRKAFAGLATAMGQPNMNIGGLRADLESSLGVDEIRSLSRDLDNLPAARAADQAAIAAELRARQARASRIPSLNLNLLHRRDLATRKSGADIGIGIALPLFDNKQAAASAFEADAESARSQAQQLRQRAKLTYRQLIADLETALQRHDHIRDEILPHHERIVSRRRALFEAGETDRDDYEVARLELTTEKRHQQEALREVHLVWAQLSALVERE